MSKITTLIEKYTFLLFRSKDVLTEVVPLYDIVRIINMLIMFRVLRIVSHIHVSNALNIFFDLSVLLLFYFSSP